MARSRMIGMGTPSIHSRIPRPIECPFLKLVADSPFSISLRLFQVHLRRALAALRIDLTSSVVNLPSVRYHTVGKHQKQRGGEWIRKLRIDKARSAWRCRSQLSVFTPELLDAAAARRQSDAVLSKFRLASPACAQITSTFASSPFGTI